MAIGLLTIAVVQVVGQFNQSAYSLVELKHDPRSHTKLHEKGPCFVKLPSVRAQSQQPDAKKMAEMMKATQPGEEHRQLDVKFKYGSGPERQGKASSEAKWILGNRFLRQEYQAESGQVTLQFIGYDNQKKKFCEVKMDNMDTGVLYTEGGMSGDGKVITNVGDRTDTMTGEKNRLRIVITIVDKDHYTVEWFITDREGNEQKTVTMMHTRKG